MRAVPHWAVTPKPKPPGGFGGRAFRWGRRLLGGLLFGLALVIVAAAEPDPKALLAPGATRDAVIDTYGWPTGQSKSGAREILSYPQGTVTLENGRVESVNFTMKPPWPPPRPRPDGAVPRPESGAVTEVAGAVVNSLDGWWLRYDVARDEAARRQQPILLLLLDPEGSAASERFDREVARHPEFVAALQAGVVFLRLDPAAEQGWSAEVRAQHQQLRATIRAKTFPALRLLAPDGVLRAEFDLAQIPPGDGFRAGVVSAVKAARNHLFRHLPESGSAAPAAAGGSTASLRSIALDFSLLKAKGVVVGAILLGVVLAALLFWFVWRPRRAGGEETPREEMSQRISDAASGLPSQADLVSWPRRRLVALLAAYVEAEGYAVEVKPEPADFNLALRRDGSERPQVLIRCAGSEAGVVTAKRVREFLATLAAEGVEMGWYVAPAGFVEEAKTFAAQHGIQLLDGAVLTTQLRELPPLVLPKVLARAHG